MRSLLVVVVLLALAGPARASTPSYDVWELGFMLGSPTGLTAKKWLGGSTAFDLGVGVGPGLRFQGDYLLALAEPVHDRSVALDLYLGGGALIGSGRGYCSYYRASRYCDGDLYLGGRVPFGVDVRLQKAPVVFGLELAPGLVFGTFGVGGLLDALIYVRFVLGH